MTMIKSSYLNPENKHSINRAVSFKNISDQMYGQGIILGPPLVIIFIDLLSRGGTRIFTQVFLLFYAPFILGYVWLSWKFNWFIVFLWWDWKVYKKILAIEGVVSNKRGTKTMGMLVDEYTIKLDGKTNYYIDRDLYSKIKIGDKIKLRYLANSKVVTEYEM